MSRAFLLVLDSLGVGPAADAARYGDEDANTLGHLAAAVPRLHIPHLERLGLGAAAHSASGAWPRHLSARDGFEGLYGCADERSTGKDTPSGHWEMAGLPVEFAWGTFPPEAPSFPVTLIDALVRDADLPGVLGNCARSGTTIIEELGAEHVATGKPIVYTSADSVLQIAAHEESFGLERLYEVCLVARRLVDEWKVGRVIARPFVGTAGAFQRTTNRRDYTTPPHGETLLDILSSAGREVIAIGKIADIFAHRGVTQTVKAPDNDAVFDAVLRAVADAPTGSLTFANFVDFDMLFGHRRDPAGYAVSLEAFDARLPELGQQLRPGDLVLLTADHGNDPTAPGTDHTRERVPIVGFGPGIAPGPIGVRSSFADIGQTVATHLGMGPLAQGEAFA